MTTNPVAVPTTTDPRTTLLQAVDQVLALVGLVTAADLDRPTPCDEFDVRHLLGHLLGGLGRIAHVAGGGQLHDVPTMVLDVADDAWAGRCAVAAGSLRAAWADDAVLDRVLHPPFGDVPGRGAAMAYVGELTTHAWDLASAIGRRDALDEGLGAVAADVARRFIPDEQRGVIPFGPVVPVADGAAPYDRLVAWVGRDPGWTPPA
jgi:uncharacterized protein (TIGR03086 family)